PNLASLFFNDTSTTAFYTLSLHDALPILVAAINDLRNQRGADTLAGVGVGTPGFIIMEKGVITGSPNMPGFDNFPIRDEIEWGRDRKSTRLNSSHVAISYAVFCLKKKKNI